MSVLQRLTEGVISRDVSKEGAALLSKWEKTGLLEGLSSDQHKQSMSVLLENQAKELLREASSMAAGDVEGFAAVAFPIVRRVFGGLIANDLVSVQPMSLPSGLIFFLDFTTTDTLAGRNAGESIYGGGIVGRQIVQGVKDIMNTGFYGLQGAGYSSAHHSSSLDWSAGTETAAGHADGSSVAADLDFDPDLKGRPVVVLAGTAASVSGLSADEASRFVQMDVGNAPAIAVALPEGAAELSPLTGMAASAGDNPVTFIDTNGDILLVEQANAVEVTLGSVAVAKADNGLSICRLRPIRRLTKVAETLSEGLRKPSHVSRLVFEVVSSTLTAAVADDASEHNELSEVTDAEKAATSTTTSDFTAAQAAVIADAAAAAMAGLTAIPVRYPIRDHLQASTNGLGAIVGADLWPLEEPGGGTGKAGSTDSKNTIAEIDIKVDSVAVTAQTKKLKAKWSPELGQDLNAYHNLDAEVELTGILSEQIALEIDREILNDLVRGSTAGVRYWSRAPGLFVAADGSQIGAEAAAPDFTGTVSEWYETLVETINDVSAQIHRKTLRGGANFLVVSPEVANILEFTSGFRANVTMDGDKGTVGAMKAGSISKKWEVYVDPYFLRNVVLVGRKGSSFLESGFVYAPYVPLQVTPTIFGTEDFVPRKGVMTRYAKKMVRPDMYGLVVVRGLLGEEG